MSRYTTYKCGEMDLNFFSRDVTLYRFISGVIDLISSKRSDLLSQVARKFIICTSMEQKCRIIITRVSAQSYQPFK